MKIRQFIIVLFLLSIQLGLNAAGDSFDPTAYVNVLQSKIVTPAHKICDTYAKGRLKALCIVPYKLGAREVLEVAQRFPFDFEVVTTGSHKHLDFTKIGHFGRFSHGLKADLKHKTVELKRKLAMDYDLIAIGNYQWENLPDEIMELILEKVEAGTGLVVTYDPSIPDFADGLVMTDYKNSQKDFIVREVPFSDLDAFKKLNRDPKKIVQCLKLGRGRIVFLRLGKPSAYNGGHAFTPVDDVASFDRWANNYESYISLFLKSALFVARKEPDILFGKLEIQQNKGTLSLVGNQSLSLGVAWEVVLRDDEGRQELLLKGQGPIAFELPILKIGTHFLESKIFLDQKLVNWATFGFKVKGESFIQALTLSKPRFKRGEKVTGKILFKRPPGQCTVELIDYWGRVVDRVVNDELQKNDYSFALDQGGDTSLRFRVRCIATRGELKADATKSFFVDDNGRGRFQGLYWSSYPPSYLATLAENRMVDAGWRVRFPLDNRMSNSYGVNRAATLSYLNRFDTDQKIKTMRTQVRHQVEKTLDRPVFAYFLGDENVIGHGWDVGLKSPLMAKFPDYVKGIYHTIGNLNRHWKTSYQNFSEVTPLKLSDAESAGVPARWVVFRKFIADAFFRVHTTATEEIQQLDPNAPTGIEGTDFLAQGKWFNPFRLYQDCGVWGPYPSFFYSMVLKSIRDPYKPFGYWFGGYRDTYMGRVYYGRSQKSYQYLLWKHLMDGSGALWWFSEGGTDGIFGLGLDFTYYYKWLHQDVRLITSSLGPVLQKAQFENDSVAVLYSQSSVVVSVAASRNQTLFQSLGVDLVHMMQASGIQPRMIDEDELALNKTSLRGYKVIFLPYNISMSDEVIAKLMESVQQGAMLVGVMDVGVMDQNGDYREQNPLNDVFGIDRKVNFACPSKKISLKWQGDFLGSPVSLEMKSLVAGTSLVLTTGKSLIPSTVPLFIHNRYGKGQGLLFNSLVSVGDKRKPKVKQLAAVWKAITKHGKVSPVATIAKEPTDSSLIEISTFRVGDVLILGLLKNIHLDADKLSHVTVNLNQKYEIYDLLTGENKGVHDVFKTVLNGTKGSFFTLFSKQQPAFDFTLEANTVALGGVLKLINRVESSNRFRDRYSLSVYSLDAKYKNDLNAGLCSWWSRSFVAGHRESVVNLPIAYNEKPGRYRLVLRRDMTGQEQETEFTIQSP